MDQKNRVIFSMAVILLIFAALIISFGRSLFRTETPNVSLPALDIAAPDSPGQSGQEDADPEQLVAVTPQTVQSVIATLARTDSYYREVTIERFWTGGASSTTAQVWLDQDWSHIRQQLPSGSVRHDLVGPDTVYYWYDGSSRYRKSSTDEYSADLAQYVPTYETVLDLDPASITAAGYELKNEVPCIYVESVDEHSANLKQYWVSVDNGLLVCAELRREDEVCYRMSAAAIQSPCPASASFQLPDGTVLHTP